jgi:hypothetical protein
MFRGRTAGVAVSLVTASLPRDPRVEEGLDQIDQKIQDDEKNG